MRAEKLLIIGAGPAGYTAAIYAARANLDPVMFAGLRPGGQLTTTTDVENFPGFVGAVQGPWLMEQMALQAERLGVRIRPDVIVRADLQASPFRFETDAGDVFLADAAVLATGAEARWLGVPGESEYRGFGVSACATCDGFFFRDQVVAVIGGGSAAAEEALYLTRHARHVVLIHRGSRLRAEPTLQDRLLAHPRIEVRLNSVVEEIIGTREPVRSVTAVSVRTAGLGVATRLAVDGVFVAIGHDPASSLVRGQVDIDPAGYVVVPAGSTATSVPGLFAAGDVADPVYRQAVTSAGMGCMAALEALRYLDALARPTGTPSDGAEAQAPLAERAA